MTEVYDIIIVGSGPAGVSAAFPLVEAGLKVLMLDAGKEDDYYPAPPEGNFLDTQHLSSFSNTQQPSNIVGEQIYKNISPKIKTPVVQNILESFLKYNKIISKDFVTVGALTAGGLSNIWGAGISFYNDDDLAGWPISYADLAPAYAAITKRIGISGSIQSVPGDISPFIQPPVKIDSNHQYLLDSFNKKRGDSFNVWPSQNAVITKEKDRRLSCNSSGLCLWGCSRHSIWNAKMDIVKLKKYPNFSYLPNVFVEKLERNNDVWSCLSFNNGHVPLTAKKIVLAAGTIGSTRIVLSTLKDRTTIAFKSNPSAAFMLLLPRRLGSRLENAFGMAQLSFSCDKRNNTHGNLFSAAMIPRSEYLVASAIPYIILNPILSIILSASIVGNCFFKGELSDHSLSLLDDDSVSIHGGYATNADEVFRRTKKTIMQSFMKLGAVMIPSSFRMSEKGVDIHYAATMPMKKNPSALQTNVNGQLAEHEGLYIVDGSVFSNLPAKPLTLTIMANAHRIATLMALQWCL